MAQRKTKSKKRAKRHSKRKEPKRPQQSDGKGGTKRVFGAASVVCLSVLLVGSFGLAIYFLQEGKKSHALWCFAAAAIFAVIGIACYIQGFVIEASKPSEAYKINRGYIEIGGVGPRPPVFVVGKETVVYVTWANYGNSAAEIKEGKVHSFISPTKPSDIEISCPDTGKSIDPGIVLRGNPRTDKFWYESNLFTDRAIKAFSSGKEYFGICGQVHYVTLGHDDTYEFCTYYEPEEQTYVDCKKPKKK